MEQHVKAVAWLQIGLSIVWIILGFAMAAILIGVGVASHDRDAVEILSIIAPIIIVFCVLTSIPSIVGGIFLLKHKEFAPIFILSSNKETASSVHS